MDLRMSTPVRMVVCGPSQVCKYVKHIFKEKVILKRVLIHTYMQLQHTCFQVGKSFFVVEMLQSSEKMFDKTFDKILWAYGIEQDFFFKQIQKKLPQVEFVSGFPENELLDDSFISKHKNLCIVLGKL